LIWAVIKQQYEIVTFLISAGADVHRMGYIEASGIAFSTNALYMAIMKNDQKWLTCY
jgi:hypothetical protein